MLVNIIKTYRDVVAICDSNLLGKYFEEGKFQLDVKESFFKGDEKTETEVLEIIDRMSLEDATFNIIGEESIKTALKAGIISSNGIQRIQSVPFSLVLV